MPEADGFAAFVLNKRAGGRRLDVAQVGDAAFRMGVFVHLADDGQEDVEKGPMGTTAWHRKAVARRMHDGEGWKDAYPIAFRDNRVATYHVNQMNARPPSLRDLAAKLGISHAAVSMALRNHPSISRATRERVQELAKQMNYRGNILVNALMTQVRRGRVSSGGEVIGLLLEGAVMSTAPSVVEGVEAARRQANLAGLRLDIFLLGRGGEDSASVNRVLFSRGIRGVIVGPMPLELSPLAIDWGRYACMAIGYSFQQVIMHRVANAHFAGLMACYMELRKTGCERIGCVLGRDEDERSRYFWQAAARTVSHLHGGAAIPPLMMERSLQRALFEQWFHEHRPQAVIGNYPDYVAEWITRMKLDATYVSLDYYTQRPWAGIRQSWAEIFAATVDQLVGKLARNEFGLPETPRTTLIEGVWVAGSKRKTKRSGAG